MLKITKALNDTRQEEKFVNTGKENFKEGPKVPLALSSDST